MRNVLPFVALVLPLVNYACGGNVGVDDAKPKLAEQGPELRDEASP